MANATPAMAALTRAGITHRVHQIDHDPSVTAYGREAAEALGADPGRVFKTLICSVAAQLVAAQLVVAIVPVSGELNLKAVATALTAKSAEMADPAVAQRATGYVVGGISPIGQKRRLPTLLDRRATAWETIYVSGGRRGLELELAPADLLRVTRGTLADIARPG